MAPLPITTHISKLIDTATTQPDLPALKIPQFSDGGISNGWETITFAHFLRDVENAARYWANELSQKGVKYRDVVGIWVKGLSYIDGVLIWGLLRAGYIPQLFSLRLTNSDVISTLLERTGGKAVVVESEWLKTVNVNQPSLPAVDTRTLDVNHLPLPPVWVPASGDDTVMIFHSSGSTSGMPKPIDTTARWLNFNIKTSQDIFQAICTDGRRSVMASNGSFCHLAASFMMLSSHARGGCVVLCKNMPCTSQEIKLLVKEHGLTSLFLFASFLGDIIRESRTDKELLEALQSLSDVTYGGLPLESEVANWAREQGVKLTEGFGSTEMGIGLLSVGGDGPDAALLRPIKGATYKFVPIQDHETDGDNAGEKLLELIIPPECHNCPPKSLRNEATGDFHTGDLFVEVMPGKYQFRGRNDDWIKTQSSLRCDTKAIEENVMELCAQDLINRAVVVGSGRPSPSILVEPKDGKADHLYLREEILRRITPFHERRYMHERVDDSRFILVVPQESLPKTAKGSVQRKNVEKHFQSSLDQIYAIA
ncbi:unnamed protein product [Clonostachys solani]|uniref:AMP-dependent synthetase/ligase domain-containing protein n=1 Tax=Clonostachys solani TaxID=160281 RepID=A0A9P0ELJ5_9HYPO|nr:unnamed protein product [Clonostachys solani]